MTDLSFFHKKFFDMFRKNSGGLRDKRELSSKDSMASVQRRGLNDKKGEDDKMETGLGAENYRNVNGKVFFESLDDGPLLNILEHLSTPRDLANALGVCKAWNLAGIEGQVWKSLCRKINPEAVDPIVGMEDLRPPSSSKINNFNRKLTKYRRRSLPLTQHTDCGEGSSQSSGDSLQDTHFQDSFSSDFHSKFSGKLPVDSLCNTGFEESCDKKAPVVESLKSTHSELLEKLRSESQGFAALTCQLVGPRGTQNCIRHALHASSTDNDPDEGIAETLFPSSNRARRNSPSYWSSKGNKDGDEVETLTYELVTPVCLVHEMMVQPFEAYFQYGSPIYAAKAVRFRFGYIPGEDFFERPYLRRLLVDTQTNPAERAIWTYESPIYPMEKSNVLQRFLLPKPVLCFGGIVQVELLGSVQTQEFDQMYYVCVSHVRAIGKPLPQFMYKPKSDSESVILQYRGQHEQEFEPKEDFLPGYGIDLESRIDFINLLVKDAARLGVVPSQSFVLQRYRRALGSTGRGSLGVLGNGILEENGDIVEWYRREGGGEGVGEREGEGEAEGGAGEGSSSEDDSIGSVYGRGDNFDRMNERED